MNLGELSTDFVLPLLMATRAADRDPAHILDRFGLDENQLQQPGQWLSIPRFMRLGEALQNLTDNPALGLQAAQLGGLTGFGLAGMTALVAPDLGGAFDTLIRYEPLYAQNIRGQSRWQPDAAKAAVHFYSIAPYNTFNRFVVDSILMSWVALCRTLTGRNDLVATVDIEFETPHYTAAYEGSFPCPVQFGQPHNCVHLTAGAEQTPLLLSSAPDYRRLTHLCEQQLQALVHPLSISHKTARAIASRLPRPSSLEVIAEQLNIPHWTLRRKLQDENTSFKAVLEQTRKELACASLSHSPQPVAEVAYLVGFASTEAFQRAFKRWTGLPPGEYRRQHSCYPN